MKSIRFFDLSIIGLILKLAARRIHVVAVGAMAISSLSAAQQWDGAQTGRITVLDVTGGANYGLRVYLEGVGSMCNGGAAWAYLLDTDSNYKAYAAALLMAKAQKSQVLVYTTNKGGYCHIGYISVKDN